MDEFEKLPDGKITDSGKISKKFLDLGISSFKEACIYVHNIQYGYNSSYEDELILFKEKKGSCTTKHAIISGLAEELSIPLYKYVGVYRFTEDITTGAGKIMEKYDLPFIPMVHCFLMYNDMKFDLTAGNFNGKKKQITEFIQIKKVEPFISRVDEYILYRKIVEEKVLPSSEMKGISMKTILKAREESIKLLKDCIKTIL